MEYLGVIVTIAIGFASLIGTMIGLAYKSGMFTAGSVASDNATAIALQDMRHRFATIEVKVDHLAVQVARVEESHVAAKEFRGDMIKSMEALRDAMYRGSRQP